MNTESVKITLKDKEFGYIVLTAILFLIFFREQLLSYFIVYSDISAHYFINKINQQNLFPDDIFTKNHLYVFNQALSPDNIFLSFFFNWYYFITIYLSRIIPLVILLKIYTISQVFCCSILLLKIRNKYNLTVDKFNLLFSFFFIYFSMDTFLGGMPRGFAIVLVLYHFSIIMDNNFIKHIIVILFTAFIYPQLLPFFFINTSLSIIRNNYKKKSMKIFILLCYAFLIIIFIKYSSSYLSGPFSSENARAGYSSYKSSQFITSASYLNRMLDVFNNYILNRDDHPRAYRIVIYSYISIFILKLFFSRISPPRLFINKDLNLSLFSAFLSFIIISLPAIFTKEPVFFLHLAGKPFKYMIPLYLSFQINFFLSNLLMSRNLKFLFISSYIIFQLFFFQPHLINYNNYSEVFKDIKKLPVNAMIAGNWKDTEFIPLFTNRQVYSMHIWQELAGKDDFSIEHLKRYKFLKNLYLEEDLKNAISKLKQERISHIIVNEAPEVVQYTKEMFLSEKVIKDIKKSIQKNQNFQKYLFNGDKIVLISISDLDDLSSFTE